MRRSFYFILLIFIINLILLGITLNPYQAKAEIAAAIIVDPVQGLITDENGGSDSFTVRLDILPESNITIDFSSSDPSEGAVSPVKITLNPGNWDKPEQNLITITGVADGIDDGDILYEITGIASSGDLVPSVSVTNLNDFFPIANDDYPALDGYSPIIIPVLANDTVQDAATVQITVVSEPDFGSYTIDPENSITYTPYESFLGFDRFSYMVCDADITPDCASAEVVIKDQVPPEIISVIPVGIGETYEVFEGEIIIEVEVTDNFQVDCVEFIRWDAIGEQFIALGEDCILPYQLTINSSSLNYGWNQVYLRASDIAGNFSLHNFIWLYRITRTYLPFILSP